MSNQTAVQKRAADQKAGVDAFRRDLMAPAMAEQLKFALPAHVPVERFQRVVMTAIQNNADLLECSKQSIWNACMRAAQDGLLPDGREGAIVKYQNDAQWLPMVAGIQKKVRNSGELSGISAHVVYKPDRFRYWVDETGPHLLYEPSIEGDRSEKNRLCVFAHARTKDGETFIEVMSLSDIDKVRASSRAKKGGPWFDWWDEMAKKTAIRRISKRLPMSSDLDDLIRRDDELYNLEAPKNGVIDMEGLADQSSGSTPALEAPPSSGAPVGDDAPEADGGEGGEGQSPPTGNQQGEPLALATTIANELLDCKTVADCAGIAKLFAKEIDDADEKTRSEVERLIADRKKAITSDPDYFPGDEKRGD